MLFSLLRVITGQNRWPQDKVLRIHSHSISDKDHGEITKVSHVYHEAGLTAVERTHLGNEKGITCEFPIVNSEKVDVKLLFTIGFLSRPLLSQHRIMLPDDVC